MAPGYARIHGPSGEQWKHQGLPSLPLFTHNLKTLVLPASLKISGLVPIPHSPALGFGSLQTPLVLFSRRLPEDLHQELL